MKKYVPQRRSDCWIRSETVHDSERAKIVLVAVNSSQMNVLRFTFSLFAMCRSLFHKKSAKPFLLNIAIPKPPLPPHENAEELNPTGTHYQAHKLIEGDDRKVYKFYGKVIGE